jgi:DNA-binding response OmpR family regulator
MGEKKILIVDDDRSLRETIKKMLEVFGGFSVVMASDGKEAVKKAYMDKPDLILLDIDMPEMDGLKTLKILKEGPSTMRIPVIMLTGHGEDIFKLNASQLYDEDYITKPVEAPELVDRIEKAFERRKAK